MSEASQVEAKAHFEALGGPESRDAEAFIGRFLCWPYRRELPPGCVRGFLAIPRDMGLGDWVMRRAADVISEELLKVSNARSIAKAQAQEVEKRADAGLTIPELEIESLMAVMSRLSPCMEDAVLRGGMPAWALGSGQVFLRHRLAEALDLYDDIEEGGMSGQEREAYLSLAQLLVDEFNSGLDPEFAEKLELLMADVKERVSA